MKNQLTTFNSNALTRSLSSRLIAGMLAACLLLLTVGSSHAGSATWNLNPTNGDWFTTSNWTPVTVPNGPADTATFGVSNKTVVSTGNVNGAEVNGIVFNPSASAYTITTYTLTLISGVGITNNSGSIQNFAAGDFFSDADGSISFTNNATAGSLTAFTTVGASDSFGGPSDITFFDTSSAGNGTFTNNGASCSECYGGGSTNFSDSSTAGNATFIAYAGSPWPGSIYFSSDSTGGTARVEVFGNDTGNTFFYGNLDISDHNAPGVTVGSIEGSGTIYLAANNLTVGSNNLSTTFSGAIQDGDIFGGSGPGSLTKVGTGRLVLTYADIIYAYPAYTGGTIIEKGELAVNNKTGSGTGTGAVRVNGGILSGGGIIGGPVTVGTESGAGAILSPGRSEDKAGTLTIQSALTFNSDATYKIDVKTKRSIADKVVANGVTISGARFSFAACGNIALPPGTVFTVIENTAATPIAGTFSNLVDGSTFTAGNNTFQADYEGGDGNDLTLTVL